MVKPLFKIYVCAFLFISTLHVQGQDYIFKLVRKAKTYKAENLQLAGEKISFVNEENGDSLSFDIGNVCSIHFKDDQKAELLIELFYIDSISCTVTSIEKDKVSYVGPSLSLQTIDKSNVFGIFFTPVPYSFNKDLLNYKEDFIQYHQQLSNSKNCIQPKIIRDDGVVMENVEIQSIEPDKIFLLERSPNIVTETFIRTDQVQTIAYKTPSNNITFRTSSNYLLSKENNWIDVESLQGIYDESILITFWSQKQEVRVLQKKENLLGIFFYDFREQNMPRKAIPSMGLEPHSGPWILASINAGVGYMAAQTVDNISGLAENYVDGLRLGYTIDTKLNFLKPESFLGFGVRYNEFNSKSETASNIEIEMKMQFIGGTLIGYVPFNNNSGHFASELSLGYLSEKDYITNNNQKVSTSGSTFGAYLSLGFSLSITPNFQFNINGGIMGGYISEYELLGVTYELDKKESLFRLDGLAGFTLKF